MFFGLEKPNQNLYSGKMRIRNIIRDSYELASCVLNNDKATHGFETSKLDWIMFLSNTAKIINECIVWV